MHPIRVLVAKIGLDGHDRGAKVVAGILRNAGMEVIYTGPWQTLPQVLQTALQEDVDLIGISSLAYDHIMIPDLMRELQAHNLEIPVVVGGIIPREDEAMLYQAGVKQVFHPGSLSEEIVRLIHDVASAGKAKEGSNHVGQQD